MFNEESSIHAVLQRIVNQPYVLEVVAIDDCSTDHTWEVLKELAHESLERKMPEMTPAIRVFRHPTNLGKGAALRTGFAEVTGDIVIVQDADFEYDPTDYPKLLEPILRNSADVVFGSRFAGGSRHRVLYFWHSLGNQLLTLLSNMTTDLNLTDMECGYKVFRREVLQKIQIAENRFGFEPEIVAKVARLGAVIYEVGVGYNGRTYAEGKKINWKDGVSALRCIFKYGVLPK